MIKCTLKEYLAEMNAKYLKFGGREPPTMADISRESNVSYRKIMRLANNDTLKFDYRVGYAIIMAVRARGYDMQLSDLIAIKDLGPKENKKAAIGV